MMADTFCIGVSSLCPIPTHVPGAAPFRKEGGVCHVAGDWSVLALAQPGEVERRREAMARAAGGEGVRWDLHGISRLDTIGALLIWQAWGERLPERVRWAAGQQDVFNALSLNKGGTRDVPAKEDPWGWLRAVGMPCSARPAMAARCSSCWDS